MPDIDVSVLTSIYGPRLHWLASGLRVAADIEDLLSSEGVTVRRLTGTRMQTLDDLFDEFAVKLDFPDYFGKNWPALSECLTDLEWLPGTAYTILMLDSDRVLADERDEVDLEVLLRTLERVAETWSHPVERGEPWDRAAVPFHVLFQVTPEANEVALQRFARAGSRPSPIAAG